MSLSFFRVFKEFFKEMSPSFFNVFGRSSFPLILVRLVHTKRKVLVFDAPTSEWRLKVYSIAATQKIQL